MLSILVLSQGEQAFPETPSQGSGAEAASGLSAPAII